MRDLLISDFNSMEGNSESNSVKCNSDSNSNDVNSNSIPPGLAQANSIPIPELDLEVARNSNSGAELTPALVPTHSSKHTLTLRPINAEIFRKSMKLHTGIES